MKTTAPLILIVDDDRIHLEVTQRQLDRSGYRTVACLSPTRALQEVKSRGIESFDAVLTDYSMPEMDGIELAQWILNKDESLRVVLVTAMGNKAVVQQAMRAGLYSYVEKPFSTKELEQTIQDAVASTKKRRAVLQMQESAARITQMHHRILDLSNLGKVPGLGYYFRSHGAVGGDYLQFFNLDADSVALIAADVAGHDLYSTYVSAYFLGALHAKIRNRLPLDALFKSMNDFIINVLNTPSYELSASGFPLQSSISMALITYSRATKTLTTLNHGLPMPVLVQNHQVISLDVPRSPLGWSSIIGQAHPIEGIEAGQLYLWSDGVETVARARKLNPFSLLYHFLIAKQTAAEAKEILQDDISALCYDLAGRQKKPTLLFHAELEAQPLSNIDDLEEEWHRSLQLCLLQVSEICFHELILVMRELVLNGLAYGVPNPDGDSVTLSLFREPGESALYIRFTDAGTGHAYNLEATPEELLQQLQRSTSGLYIIRCLTHRIKMERRGACLLIEFILRTE
jgi:CheY-like chemotaxis protein